jgi:hypothetical protein
MIAAAVLAAALACGPNPLGTRTLHLRGDFNAWAATEETTLRWSCDHFEGVVTIPGRARFKIGDEAWSPDADFGWAPTQSNLRWLTLKGGDITHEFHGTHRIRLRMSPDDPTQASLAIEDCPLTTGAGAAPVFLRGEMNAWNALDAYAFQFSCDAYY